MTAKVKIPAKLPGAYFTIIADVRYVPSQDGSGVDQFMVRNVMTDKDNKNSKEFYGIGNTLQAAIDNFIEAL